MAKQRARVAPQAAHRSKTPARVRRGNPILTLGLVGATVVAVLALLAWVLSQSGGSNAAQPTPTAAPAQTADASLPDYSAATPQEGIGVMNERVGLAKSGPAPAVGTAAPDFDWMGTTGVARFSNLIGHPVLLEFFAPYCVKCQTDVPLLNTLQLTYAKQGLTVLSVSGSPNGKDYESQANDPISIADVVWFRQHLGATYPQVFDPGSRVFNLYGYGKSYPTFFVIDAKGTVRFTTSVAISDKDLTKQVQAVL